MKLAQRDLRAQVVSIIFKELKRRRLTQATSAKLLGIKQPDISKLKKGDYSGFSLERLLKFLVKLGMEIEIEIK